MRVWTYATVTKDVLILRLPHIITMVMIEEVEGNVIYLESNVIFKLAAKRKFK